MGDLRRYHRVCASLAIIGLVANIIASVFCCAPSYSRKAEILDPILGAIPLCTSAFGNPDDSSKQPKGSKQQCPICLAAAHKAVVVGTFGPSFAALTRAEVNPTRIDSPAIGEELKVGGLGSRAPPLHA